MRIFEGIVTCEKEQASHLENTTLLLIILGISVIVLSKLILVPFAYFVQNRLNHLWSQIRNVSNDENSSLRLMLIDRLEKIHNEIDLQEVFNKKPTKSKTRSFNYVQKYSLGVMVLPIIGAIYFLIANYVYYTNIEGLLSARPQLLSYLIISSVNLSHLDIWVSQVWGVYINYNFQTFYPEFIPENTDYSTALQSITKSLLSDTRAITSTEYQVLLGNDIYQSFVNSTSSDLYVLKYGYSNAINYLVLEGLFIGYSQTLEILGQYMVFYGNLRLIGRDYQQVFQDILLYSKSVINSKLNEFIVFSSCFCFLFYLAYIVCYYPFLTMEQKKIFSMAEFAKILISNSKPSC